MSLKRYSFWWEDSPPDFALQSQLPQHADIVIVGAGFAGICTAYWLTRIIKSQKKPYRIIVVDEAPYPGFKATGRMTGSVYLGSNKLASILADQLGAKSARDLYRYSSANNSFLDALVSKMSCGAEFNGGLRMASTAKETVGLHNSLTLLKEWGFYPAFFDQNRSQHLAVTPLVKGSLFIPNEGLIDPFSFTNSIARVLRRHQVWIAYGARVKTADVSTTGSPCVQLENGHVLTAGKVVHTTTNTVPWDMLQEAVVHRRETVVRTAPISKDLDNMPLPLMPIELNGGLDSIRPHDRSVIMTGGKSGMRKKDPELGVINDTSFNQRILDNLDSTMIRNFPFTNHTDLSHAWTYVETEARDGLPFVGELPEHSGHYVNVAFGRNKFGLAFLSSKNLAERILRTKVQNSEFNLFNPKRLT
jgi:glycine/D-amino acid oxidase-like deaminating enzyme